METPNSLFAAMKPLLEDKPKDGNTRGVLEAILSKFAKTAQCGNR